MANLIVYYSRKGQNHWNGSIKNLEKGNTEIVAELVQKAVGGDLFEIDTVKPYAEDYYVCIDEAKKELRANARPELKNYPDSLDGYENIFVGYPNWWGTMPMAMFTFLERYDLTGKKIIPFCTNEGSGFGSSITDIRNTCTGATVIQGFSCRGSSAGEQRSAIEAWISSLALDTITEK